MFNLKTEKNEIPDNLFNLFVWMHAVSNQRDKLSEVDSLKKVLMTRYDRESKGDFLPTHEDSVRYDSIRSESLSKNFKRLRNECHSDFAFIDDIQGLNSGIETVNSVSREIRHWKIKDLYDDLERYQQKSFIYFRTRFAEILNDKLWIDDGKAKAIGEGYSTLRIISAEYAANRNVKESYDTLKETLKKFRFEKVEFLWYDGDDDYESFLIRFYLIKYSLLP